MYTKLVYHNGIINLLLTSCGKYVYSDPVCYIEIANREYTTPSLQRIECSNTRLERRFSDISQLFHKMDAHRSPEAPSIFMTGDSQFGSPLLNAVLMKNAESGKHTWVLIGVDEWIQAGRWWLLKVESRDTTRSWILWLTTE